MALREENLEGASGGGKTVTDAQAEDAFRTILKWVETQRQCTPMHLALAQASGKVPA